MKALLLTMSVATIALSTAALADPAGVPCPDLTPAKEWLMDSAYDTNGDVGPLVASRKTRAMLMLRREGLLMKKQDGGALSLEHRVTLQARLNAIQSGRY
jgi:hypothetical protein